MHYMTFKRIDFNLSFCGIILTKTNEDKYYRYAIMICITVTKIDFGFFIRIRSVLKFLLR